MNENIRNRMFRKMKQKTLPEEPTELDQQGFEVLNEVVFNQVLVDHELCRGCLISTRNVDNKFIIAVTMY